MLTRLRARGFKSLIDVELTLPQLTVLFGPNAAGKSNIIEAAQLLSAVTTRWTLAEAFDGFTIRGNPLEAFAFPAGGLPALLERSRAGLTLEADLALGEEALRYRVGIQMRPDSGSLTVDDEYLTRLDRSGDPKQKALIERDDGRLTVRRSTKGRPSTEEVGYNYTLISDRRLSGERYEHIERCRREFEEWRVYYLDPRVNMRAPRPPREVRDIGVLGQDIAPYLHRLQVEHPKPFAAVKRTLSALIPGIRNLEVELDEKRGLLDIAIEQEGRRVSSRIVSEGTLRVLAVCAIAANPWTHGLVAFEEPENGVHPRRLELLSQLLKSIAIDQGRQLIVTTHSPLFCAAMLRLTAGCREQMAMLNVQRDARGTTVKQIEFADSLFEGGELAEGFSSQTANGIFEGLILRGILDE